MDQAEKVRENRLRRAAQRQRLILEKSRRRDPRAYDYGMYVLKDEQTMQPIFPSGYSLTIDDVERHLNK